MATPTGFLSSLLGQAGGARPQTLDEILAEPIPAPPPSLVRDPSPLLRPTGTDTGAPPVAPVAPVELPPVVTTSRGRTVTGAPIGKAEAAAAQRLAKFQEQGRQEAAKLTAINIGKAEAERDAAIQAEAAALAEEERARNLEQAAQTKLKTDEEAFRADAAAMQGRDYRGFWAERSTGEKVLAAVSLALSGIGDVFAAKAGIRGDATETTLNILHGAMERDWRMWRAGEERRERILASRGLQVQRSQAELERLRAAHRVAGLSLTQATAKRILSRTGASEAEIEGNKLVARLGAEAAKEERDYLAGRAARVTQQTGESITAGRVATGTGVPGAPKPASEGQSLANSRLTVMLPELKRMEELPPLSEKGRKILFEELALRNFAEKNPGVDVTTKMLGVRRSIEAQLKGTDRQVYAASLAFLDPVVRQRTGANAPASEVAALAAPIIPAAGDKATDIAIKRERRRDWMDSFVVQSNEPEAWRQRIDAAVGPRDPAALLEPPPLTEGDLLPPGAEVGTFQGQRGYKLGGEFFPFAGE